MDYLNNLNDMQKKAVTSFGKPILIFAGAGSGKTRVLTHKIAYLIDNMGMPPENILAVTFTNKAASEMKSRVKKLIDSFEISKINIGTFHSICALFLRKNIHLLDYKPGFTIYDQDDSTKLVKNVIKELDLDSKQYNNKNISSLISNLKNKMISCNDYERITSEYRENKIATIYEKYQKQIKENNAVDFDDLLLLPLEIFEKFPEKLTEYQQKYQYVLVDEYQDTNKPQFEFIYSITKSHGEICVVGDDDQSIYGWRGADISNILNFSDAFGDSQIFKLEQNYRSSQNILDAAHFVISKNSRRADKKLWTDNKKGDPIYISENGNDAMEADQILKLIYQNTSSNQYNLSDIVILYRTNAQSRIIEDKLRRQGIPYHIIGGVKFYERKEIKDLLGYLRVVSNQSDNLSLIRILNFPPRGIGKTSIDKIIQYSKKEKLSIFDALNNINHINIGISQKKTINTFIKEIIKINKIIEKGSIVDIIKQIIDNFNIKDHYDKQNTSDSQERWQNIEELVNGMIEYANEKENPNLVEFLEEISLLTDIDKWNDEVKQITLMTIHSSKGLEFPIVFISGLEEGLFPISQYLDQNDELEEERRLFYVGTTRAMEKLYLSYSKFRRRFGSEIIPMAVSRFINELPKENIEYIGRAKNAFNYERSFSEKETLQYKKGQIVNHSLFGKGKIIDLDGNGDNAKITVMFHGNVQKKLIAKYANLKIVYN